MMVKPTDHCTLFPFRRVALPVVLAGSLPSLVELPMPVTAVFFLLLTFSPLFLMRKTDLFRPFCLISMMYALAMPIAVLFRNYYNDPVWRTISDFDLNAALTWGYRGYALLFIGYLGSQFFLKKSRRVRTILYGQNNVAFEGLLTLALWSGILALAGGVISIIADGGVTPVFLETTLTGQVSTLRQSLLYLKMLAYPFLCIYLMLRWRGIRTKRMDMIFVLVLGLHTLIIVGAGAKFHVFAILVSIALAASFASLRISLRKIILNLFLALSIYVTFSVITNYRILATNTYVDSNADISDSVTIQAGTFTEAVKISIYKAQTERTYRYETVTQIMERLALISSFSKIMEFTEQSSRFENALESIVSPVYALLPRTLFPDKPVFFHSGEFARYFGWRFGGVSVTLAGSLYWAWGYWGICFGMLTFGVALSYFEMRAKERSFRGGMYAVLFVELVLQLLDVGTIFQAIVSDIFRTWLLLLVMHAAYRLFGRRLSRQSIREVPSP